MTKERSEAKAQRPIKVVQPDGTVAVEKYGDVDHQSKKAKVDLGSYSSHKIASATVLCIPFI